LRKTSSREVEEEGEEKPYKRRVLQALLRNSVQCSK